MFYGEQKWTEVPTQTGKVVVLPLGSTEQHGYHLPLLTDTMICEEIVRRAEGVLGDEALFLPMLWVGVSEHHLGFPGTVSVKQETYVRLLVDVLESLVGSGFKRILMLNAHGGNSVPGQAALYEVQMRHRDKRDLWLVLATWFVLAAPQIAALPELDQKRVSHACELETSMILRLRPELVDLDAARGTDRSSRSTSNRSNSTRTGQITTLRPFDHTSKSGAYGHPERATAVKGETLFSTAVDQVVACVREVAGWQAPDPQ
jgi:creatinine amidohydrolase